jgi:hypothetical protein
MYFIELEVNADVIAETTHRRVIDLQAGAQESFPSNSG